MEKVILRTAALCMALCLLLAGCSSADAGNVVGEIESQTAASAQENSETPQQPFEDAMSYILPYLDRQLNSENAESEGTESMLQM